MSDPGGLAAFLVGFLTDPTFSIPLLLSAWALVAWVAWSPGGADVPPAFRATWAEPTGEMVSRMYYAVTDRAYSRVIGLAAEALDAATVRRCGMSAYGLPWTRAGARRIGLPEAPEVRRAVRELAQVHARATEREGRFRIRWRFWVPPAVEERRFLGQVDRALGRTRSLCDRLEHAP